MIPLPTKTDRVAPYNPKIGIRKIQVTIDTRPAKREINGRYLVFFAWKIGLMNNIQYVLVITNT